MSMSSTKTDPALHNASINDPACIKAGDACPAFSAAQKLSQKQVSYYHQFDYGHYVSWYLLATLGIFMFAYIYGKWAEKKRAGASVLSSANSLSKGSQKTKALVRYVSYRRIPGILSDRLGMPSAGMIVLILLFTLYCLLLTFLIRPYYRQHRGYGSPPIGVRTGLMAIALTPWIIALSGKANLITILTGMGHEKLNIIHRWIGRICLGLSVIHTVPFIVAPLRDGGPAALHKQFYKPGAFEYTGVPPLVILFGIVVLSIRWLRHRFYESFYFLHFFLAVSYLGLMFWHAGEEGDSWTYLWVTVATWLFTVLARVFWYNRASNIRQPHWFQGFNTEVKLLSDNVIKIVVHLPEEIWVQPGQHCFLRFPVISPLDNHPFTVAWTNAKDTSNENQAVVPNLTFFIRSHKGFTAKLLDNIEKPAQESARVWIDGPYGGIDARLEAKYDQVVLVAGGIGITGCLPWLQQFVHHRRTDGGHTQLSSVKLVWTVHETSHIEWATPCLQSLSQSAGGLLEVEIHCTTLAGEAESPLLSKSETETADLEKAGSISKEATYAITPSAWRLFPGRPRLDSLISSLGGGKAVVIGCGPTSLKTDLSNACAGAQSRVLKGELEELSLYTETFGW